MNILIFEWMIGGGRLLNATLPDPNCPFERQGKAMAAAICEDFAKAGHSPVLLLDARHKNRVPVDLAKSCPNNLLTSSDPEEFWGDLRRRVEETDFALIIAPDSEGCLTETLNQLKPFQDKLLNPNLEFVRLTSDKQKTSEFCSPYVPTIPGFLWTGNPDLDGRHLKDLSNTCRVNPASLRTGCEVRIKPNDGAGSEGQWVIHSDELARRLCVNTTGQRLPRIGQRIEINLEGTPASVAGIIIEEHDVELLPPTRQQFDSDGTFLTAVSDLTPAQSQAATELAKKISRILRPKQGYFGMDILIDNSGQARLIEVNPRLTTSYTHLRQSSEMNLAERMLSYPASKSKKGI